MFVDSVEDRQLMLGQTGLCEVMRLIDQATPCLIGIGKTAAGGELAFGNTGEHDRSPRAEAAREPHALPRRVRPQPNSRYRAFMPSGCCA